MGRIRVLSSRLCNLPGIHNPPLELYPFTTFVFRSHSGSRSWNEISTCLEGFQEVFSNISDLTFIKFKSSNFVQILKNKNTFSFWFSPLYTSWIYQESWLKKKIFKEQLFSYFFKIKRSINDEHAPSIRAFETWFQWFEMNSMWKTVSALVAHKNTKTNNYRITKLKQKQFFTYRNNDAFHENMLKFFYISKKLPIVEILSNLLSTNRLFKFLVNL